MKKLFSVLLILTLLLALAGTVLALEPAHFTDAAGALSQADADRILDLLDSLTKDSGTVFAAATLDSQSLTLADAASGFVSDFGSDGVLLLVDPASRDWSLTAYGAGETLLNKDAVKVLRKAVSAQLKTGDYAAAFTAYADTCARILRQTQAGKAYKAPFNWSKTLIVSLIVSFLAALIATGVMKGKLTSVYKADSARSYIREGSFRLSEEREIYLYRKTEKKEKAQKADAPAGGKKAAGGKF